MNENLLAFLQLTLKFKVACRQDFCKVTVFSYVDNNESFKKAINENEMAERGNLTSLSMK